MMRCGNLRYFPRDMDLMFRVDGNNVLLQLLLGTILQYGEQACDTDENGISPKKMMAQK